LNFELNFDIQIKILCITLQDFDIQIEIRCIIFRDFDFKISLTGSKKLLIK